MAPRTPNQRADFLVLNLAFVAGKYPDRLRFHTFFNVARRAPNPLRLERSTFPGHMG